MKKLLFVALWLVFLLAVLPNNTAEKPATTESSVVAARIMQVPISCYISKTNILESVFTEPYEVALMFFSDGTVYLFTNQLADRIIFPQIEEFFEEEGREIKDILLIVHNHSTPHRFSEADKMLYSRLKDDGFVGKFAIYYPFSKSVLFFD